MKIESQLIFRNSVKAAEPDISLSGIVKTDDSWKQEPLYSSCSRLYYVTGGSGMLISENEQMPLESGYVYIAPCGMKCGFYGTPSVSKLFFHINLSLSSDGHDVFEKLGHFARLPRDVSYIEKLKSWYMGQDPLGHFMLKNELYKTICEFIRTAEKTRGAEREFSKSVSDAINYVRSHLTASLTVSEVAEASLCSRSTLSTLFKNEVGQSVAAYIEDLLMSEAQTMLLYSDRSIGQISEKLGFCDQFYFSRRFRKRFGLSPKDYRKKSSDQIDN